MEVIKPPLLQDLYSHCWEQKDLGVTVMIKIRNNASRINRIARWTNWRGGNIMVGHTDAPNFQFFIPWANGMFAV
jgi:hypothetical protein